MRAYQAIVKIHSKGTLLGGSPVHKSWPFESEANAIAWAEQCVTTNKGLLGPDADIRYIVQTVEHTSPILDREVL